MSIHDSIKREYEKIRKMAEDELGFRKAEIYSKISRIEEIDNEIRLAGLKYSKTILTGTSFLSEVSDELSFKLAALKNEKQHMLQVNGYDTNYLEPIYSCIQCKDTGYAMLSGSNEMCGCYKQKLVEQLFGQSNMNLTLGENFSCFDENLFPDLVDEGKYKIKVSPRKRILSIRERCMKFIEGFSSPDEQNLFFVGPTGVGKTFMSNCIAAELIRHGISVLYQSAPIMFENIRAYKTREFNDSRFEDKKYRLIYDTQLLIIDDLGTEAYSSSKAEDLLMILNARRLNNTGRVCKTIISTNIPVKKLHEYYTERVASRIVGDFSLLQFAGEDIRTVKKLAPR